MTQRQRRAVAAARLAPVAPPCFAARDQWTEYVAAAAMAQRSGHLPGPLVLAHGVPVRFNPRFSFCSDCSKRHEGAMKAAGRCNPRHLLQLFAAKTAAKEIA